MTETNNNTQGEKAKISRLAVLSFVLAIMLWFCNFAIPAFCGHRGGTLFIFLFSIFTGSLLMSPIFGLIALRAIRKSGGQLKGKGYAFSGIAATAIFFILLFISLLAAYSNMRR